MKYSDEENYKRMTETPIPKLIISLAVPTTVSQLITTIYNTADTFFVSQLSTSATAAAGVVFALMTIMQAVGSGLGMGANSLISRMLGAKRKEEADCYGSSAFFASIIFGFFLLILGLCFLEELMTLLGSTKTILPYACDYGGYILIGAPIMCSSYVMNNILRSEGEALLAMWGLSIGGIINVFLDPVLIFYFQMGIKGAAIATVLSQTISFVILLSMFLRKKSMVSLNARCISIKPYIYLEIIKSGLPTICRQALGSVSSSLLNIQAAQFGDVAVAAVTIANKVYVLVRNLILGIGQGFQPVVGFNYGAGKKDRVRQAFVFTCQVGTILCTTIAVILSLNASNVIAWFRKDDLEVIRMGGKALYFACFVMPMMAYSTYVNQLYQSLGFSSQATFLASCRQGICFIPLVFILPTFLSDTGVEMAQPASDFLTFLISIVFQKIFFNKI